MPTVGFEPTISVLEQAKTVHALDQCGPTFSYPRANQILVYESEGQRH
jgi:hypothetical protein